MPHPPRLTLSALEDRTVPSLFGEIRDAIREARDAPARERAERAAAEAAYTAEQAKQAAARQAAEAAIPKDRDLSSLVTFLDDRGQTRTRVSAFENSFTGGIWVASADVTGDGVADRVAAPGPGRAPEVKVFDGKTGGLLRTVLAYEPGFTGGVYVTAADFNADGKADLVVGTDRGGGPRVRVLDGASVLAGEPRALADFFAIDDGAFRGGVRVAAGDVNGDGTPDLLAAAGVGGGPRVAGFDGKALAEGRVERLFGDFFAFEEGLRNGVYPAVGDVDGDGKGDLMFGAGPGGGPRVLVFDGAESLKNRRTARMDFFAGDAAARDGVRVGAVAGGKGADVIAAPNARAGGSAVVYSGRGGAALSSYPREMALGSGLFDSRTPSGKPAAGGAGSASAAPFDPAAEVQKMREVAERVAAEARAANQKAADQKAADIRAAEAKAAADARAALVASIKGTYTGSYLARRVDNNLPAPDSDTSGHQASVSLTITDVTVAPGSVTANPLRDTFHFTFTGTASVTAAGETYSAPIWASSGMSTARPAGTGVDRVSLNVQAAEPNYVQTSRGLFVSLTQLTRSGAGGSTLSAPAVALQGGKGTGSGYGRWYNNEAAVTLTRA